MITWNLSDIVHAVAGELINPPASDIQITGISHDSRELEKGAIFVPIVAERNGHDFLQSARNNGAAASFWSDDLTKAPTDFPLIKVEDTQKAFMDFGKWYLNQVNPKVVGITGSNGKTTTKDMTAAVLGTKYAVHKTAGNENNQLGVPKTLLSMPKSTEILVLEMGMSWAGEITILSNVAKPDVAAITMIGESHIEAFGSRAKIAEEKLSILDGLKEDGLFVWPFDEPLIADRLDSTIRNKTFGLDDSADAYAFDIVEDTKTTTFSVNLSEETVEINLPIPGKYNASNALIAILIGQEFGVSLKEAKMGLEHLEMTKNRLEWLDGKNNTRLLNDAYNASPTSMKAALGYFSNIQTDAGKIAVLGDIRELGDLSKELHESIAEAIDLEKLKALLLYGEEIEVLYNKLKGRNSETQILHFEGEKDQLIETIQKLAEPNDVILFKSSNGTDLLSVVNKLKEKD